MKISKSFVDRWAKIHKDEGSDGHKELRIRVESDMKRYNTISIGLIDDIINWKSAMIGWKLSRDGKIKIKSAIRAFGTYNDYIKLDELLKIHGIGVPAASTFLHLLYPNKFPIIDRRVLRVLKQFKLINKEKPINAELYQKYVITIDEIVSSIPRCTIRKLDNALFSYDKKNNGALPDYGKHQL